MGKRKNAQDLKKIKEKIRKLEKKLQQNEEVSDSSSIASIVEENVIPEETVEDNDLQQRAIEVENPVTTIEPAASINTEEELPEEFLIALGNEGIQNFEITNPIRPELSQRWANLMREGLGKESKDQIFKKYSTPSNFREATAPSMNPEILASLSETGVNRDKRIVYRQNITGKLMSCLGKSLTNLLKGNVNSKQLIEEINDAAKLAADIFYQDSVSRKFFALTGTSKVVRDALKTAKTDEFLFGKDCMDRIKAAQGLQKTGSQIKLSQQPKIPITTRYQGNWRSPLHHQSQRQRNRSGPNRQSYKPPAPGSRQPRRNQKQSAAPPPPPARGRPQYRR